MGVFGLVERGQIFIFDVSECEFNYPLDLIFAILLLLFILIQFLFVFDHLFFELHVRIEHYPEVSGRADRSHSFLEHFPGSAEQALSDEEVRKEQPQLADFIRVLAYAVPDDLFPVLESASERVLRYELGQFQPQLVLGFAPLGHEALVLEHPHVYLQRFLQLIRFQEQVVEVVLGVFRLERDVPAVEMAGRAGKSIRRPLQTLGPDQLVLGHGQCHQRTVVHFPHGGESVRRSFLQEAGVVKPDLGHLMHVHQTFLEHRRHHVDHPVVKDQLLHEPLCLLQEVVPQFVAAGQVVQGTLVQESSLVVGIVGG